LPVDLIFFAELAPAAAVCSVEPIQKIVASEAVAAFSQQDYRSAVDAGFRRRFEAIYARSC
jgi:hypothetical protein